jgi:hypothetical protein
VRSRTAAVPAKSPAYEVAECTAHGIEPVLKDGRTANPPALPDVRMHLTLYFGTRRRADWVNFHKLSCVKTRLRASRMTTIAKYGT